MKKERDRESERERFEIISYPVSGANNIILLRSTHNPRVIDAIYL